MKVRIGAGAGVPVYELLGWIEENVGPRHTKESTVSGYAYIGEGWTARWNKFGAGWFMDFEFDDDGYRLMFMLRFNNVRVRSGRGQTSS